MHLGVIALLPYISAFILARPRLFRLDATNPFFSKDLLLTRASLVALVLAAVIQGLSPTIALFLIGLVIGGLGAGSSPLSRALITHFVEPERTSRLYALIGMMEIVGGFFGGPVLAWWFDMGMRLGGLAKGLPWFYIAAVCSVAVACLFWVRKPEERESEGDGDRDEEDLLLPIDR